MEYASQVIKRSYDVTCMVYSINRNKKEENRRKQKEYYLKKPRGSLKNKVVGSTMYRKIRKIGGIKKKTPKSFVISKFHKTQYERGQ